MGQRVRAQHIVKHGFKPQKLQKHKLQLCSNDFRATQTTRDLHPATPHQIILVSVRPQGETTDANGDFAHTYTAGIRDL